MLQNGLTHTSTRTVEEHHLAAHVGSGDLRVLATPSMIALMEEAAMHCVAPHLSEGQTTVGGHISASHLKPTAHGRIITATATLTAIEGRKLQFTVTANDEEGLIGEGEHTRFIVDREKFMARLK
ncbi:MAG: thioesterase family protein [Bacteroidaceae bacterium]|nr:thioesterase family protein [Bacteroidaceae bacterium]